MGVINKLGLYKFFMGILIVIFLISGVLVIHAEENEEYLPIHSSDFATLYFNRESFTYKFLPDNSIEFNVWLKFKYTKEGKEKFIKNNKKPLDKFADLSYTLFHMKYLLNNSNKELQGMIIEYGEYDSNRQVIEASKSDDSSWKTVEGINFKIVEALIDYMKKLQEIEKVSRTQTYTTNTSNEILKHYPKHITEIYKKSNEIRDYLNNVNYQPTNNTDKPFSLLVGLSVGSAIIPAILITIASLIFNSAQRKRKKITNIKPSYVFGISFFLMFLFVFIIGGNPDKSMNIVFAGIPVIIVFFASIYWIFTIFIIKNDN